jgi:hypothetical protein
MEAIPKTMLLIELEKGLPPSGDAMAYVYKVLMN